MRSRRVFAWLMAAALMLSVMVAGGALAAGHGGGPKGSPGNSAADLTVTFSEDCRTVTVTSDKDISYLRVDFEGDQTGLGDWDVIEEFEDGHEVVERTYDDPIVVAQAKSGTTVVTEECTPGGGGDPCDDLGGDADGDGICDDEDNCPDVANADQTDSDGDGIGDACDTEGPPGDPSCSDGLDNDGDGLIDDEDPDCQDTGDPCDELGGDTDGDGVCDDDDNCPDVANPDQEDSDGDGIGDACDHGGGTLTLTCRANLIAAALAGNALPNLFEANADSAPCASDQTGLLVALSPILGDGGAGLLDEDNRIVLSDPSGTQAGAITIDAAWADTDAGDGTADADSGVLFLSINDGSADQIVVEVLTSRSRTTAGDSCGDTETEAKVVRITIAGNEIAIPGGHTILIAPELYDLIEAHLEDADDGADEGPDDTGAQASDVAALMANVTAAVADSETGCSQD
jgi:hypothetical protein